MAKNNETLSNHQNFGTDYRKSMSLKTTVTTDFRSDVEIMQFMRICKWFPIVKVFYFYKWSKEA